MKGEKKMKIKELLNKLNEIVGECPSALDWNVYVSTEDEDATHEAALKNVNVCDCTITLEGERCL